MNSNHLVWTGNFYVCSSCIDSTLLPGVPCTLPVRDLQNLLQDQIHCSTGFDTILQGNILAYSVLQEHITAAVANKMCYMSTFYIIFFFALYYYIWNTVYLSIRYAVNSPVFKQCTYQLVIKCQFHSVSVDKSILQVLLLSLFYWNP